VRFGFHSEAHLFKDYKKNLIKRKLNMKKLTVIALAFAFSLAAADYTGAYSGKGGMQSAKYGSVPQTALLTLLQDGSSVKGTLQIGNGPINQITSGTVSGTQITFAVGTGGGTGVLTQNGAVLQGTLTSSKGAIYNIAFTKM